MPLRRRSFLAFLSSLSLIGRGAKSVRKNSPYKPSFLHPNDHWVILRGEHRAADGSGWLYEIVDLKTGKLVRRLAGSSEDTYYGTPMVLFDPSGQFAVEAYWGTHHSSLRRWDLQHDDGGQDFKADHDDVPSPIDLPPPGGILRFPNDDYDLNDFKKIRHREVPLALPILNGQARHKSVSKADSLRAPTSDVSENTSTSSFRLPKLSARPMLWIPSEVSMGRGAEASTRCVTRNSIVVESGFCTVREFDAASSKLLRVVSGTMPQTGLVAFGRSRGLLYAARPLDKPVLWDRNREPKPLPERYDTWSGWPPESLPYQKLGPGAPDYGASSSPPRPPEVRAMAADSAGLALGLEDGHVLLGNRQDADGGPWRNLGAHTEAVRGLAFAPDHPLLLSGSRDGSLKLWDLAASKLLKDFPPHEARINAVAVAPRGLAASAGPDGIRIWDLTSGTLHRHLQTEGVWVSDIALDPKGAWIAAALLDGSVRRWNVATGKLDWNHEGNHGWCACLTFDPGSGVLAAGYELGFIRLLKADSGKSIRQTQVEGQSEWQSGCRAVHSLAWSPDGKALAAAFGDLVRVFDPNLVSGQGHAWLLPLDVEDIYT